MKPAAFAYHRPDTLEGALDLLSAHGGEAALLAGGQSLLPLMNMRLARPGHVIDINRIASLTGARREEGVIEIGALTRHADLAGDPLIGSSCPLLACAASTIGHYAIRQRGTLGGSLATADPAAQLPLVAALLDAEILVRSSRGVRSVLAGDFFIAALTTALADDEMITAVRVPILETGETWGFELFARRVGDFAVVLAAATLRSDSTGRVASGRLALGGIAGAPVVMTDALSPHCEQVPDEGWPAAVADAVAGSLEPEGDGRFEADYKRDLARALIERALAGASGGGQVRR